MARLCFLLQPTRSAPNFVAFIVCVACTFFVITVMFLRDLSPGSSDYYNGDYESALANIDAHGGDKQPSNDEIAVLVITSRRVRAVTSHLNQLKKLRPGNGSLFPIVISQDGINMEVSSAVREFVLSTPYSFFIQHANRPKWTGEASDRRNRNYFYISQHYKWALNQVFTKMNYSNVLVTEEDLDIANDFFNYFANSRHLLYEDSTIWCISAYNDNGSPLSSDLHRAEQLYRTDFFPGLGWMMTSKLWKELSENWPISYWDDWMRREEIRKNRVCIRPEISRTVHNMDVAGKGTSGGMYKKNLAAIRLPDNDVDFSLIDTNKLKKSIYDKEFGQLIIHAKPITIDELFDENFRRNTTRFSPLEAFRVFYMNPRDYRKIGKNFGLMYDTRSGMQRTAYCGVVTFLVDGVRVFALHSNFNLTKPFGTYPCSEIYDVKWDLMSKYLDFAEIYCIPKRWRGKCDPNDPYMIKWFQQKKIEQRIKIWKDAIVF